MIKLTKILEDINSAIPDENIPREWKSFLAANAYVSNYQWYNFYDMTMQKLISFISMLDILPNIVYALNYIRFEEMCGLINITDIGFSIRSSGIVEIRIRHDHGKFVIDTSSNYVRPAILYDGGASFCEYDFKTIESVLEAKVLRRIKSAGIDIHGIYSSIYFSVNQISMSVGITSDNALIADEADAYDLMDAIAAVGVTVVKDIETLSFGKPFYVGYGKYNSDGYIVIITNTLNTVVTKLIEYEILE